MNDEMRRTADRLAELPTVERRARLLLALVAGEVNLTWLPVKTGIPPASVVRAARKLEAEGLIETVTTSHDRRLRTRRLTATGWRSASAFVDELRKAVAA